MSYLAPVLLIVSALLCFTDPQGLGVWVEPSQVVSVQHNAGDCARGSNSKIVTGQGSLCVKETPQQIIKQIEEAK